ncbi:NAD-dependent epimerase/dehydratase family protein [Streptodolium elevatio]|uniref:NAD-dependent epimerase/dehydratase family protein n=1 Tax=Streptodolium elevatio TaxID=3157996 RepID=A0ABV3DBB4_9ACTN
MVALLRSAGHPVAVVDNGSGGTSHRLARFAEDPGVRRHDIDICHPTAVADACAAERPWAVVHLAARHFLPSCEGDVRETQHVNVGGTGRLLAAWRAHTPVRFVFASTADVYAPSSGASAERSAVSPRTAYGRSKLAGEHMVRRAGAVRGVGVIVVRPFNLYGPEPTTPHLIPEIYRQMARGDRLRLGDLTTVRDYLHADDAASALVRLLNGTASGTWNLGTGRGTSGHGLLALAGELSGRELTADLDPSKVRANERAHLVADTTRLRRTLPDFRPTTLCEGLRRVLDLPQTSSATPEPVDSEPVGSDRVDSDRLGSDRVDSEPVGSERADLGAVAPGA